MFVFGVPNREVRRRADCAHERRVEGYGVEVAYSGSNWLGRIRSASSVVLCTAALHVPIC